VDQKEIKAESILNERIASLDGQLAELKKRDRFLGMTKLILALVGLLGLFRVFTDKPAVSFGIFGGCLVAFIATAFIHESFLRKIRFRKTLRTINENEIQYLHHQFPEKSDSGEIFKDSEHNYTADLDIFGKKGIFHFVNRAVTVIGKRRLARWLNTAADSKEIRKRQEAVNELSGNLDFRQNIMAHGLHITDSQQKLDSLYSLLKEPYVILGKKMWQIMMWGLPVLTVAAFGSMFLGVPLGVPLGFFLIQLAINKIFFKSVSHAYNATSKNHRILRAYSNIFEEIEKENFSSQKLIELKNRLSVKQSERQIEASACIRKLSTLMEYFDARNGMLHFFITNIVLWDLHCVYRIEIWRREVGARVPDWFEVIGEYESLSGFAALLYNDSRWVIPEIVDQHFTLEGVSMGHPLIPLDERICNDVMMSRSKGKGNMMIVTGPNMAGKSTFLRTVGVNIVLALAGAPVCAERFIVSPVKLFSSLQTSDSLDRHLSLFYAELQRLKMILDGISSNEPVFFLIDEMLKGTNTLDRQKGAVALLKQLMKNRANGVVATHDLKLTRLEDPEEWKNSGDTFPEGIHIDNFHFDGYVEDDKLLFDYKLKTGICESFNALVLMKKMGIEL
jgi:hypothetical protein